MHKTILFTSCNNSTSSTADYRSGTEGIVVNVLDIKKGDKFVQGENLNMMLEVFNKGLFDRPEGFITITGYGPNTIFFKSNKVDLPPLLGKKPYMPEGDSRIINFDETSVLNVPYGSSYNVDLLISTCYKFKTSAVVPICVIPSMKEYTAGTATCTVHPYSLPSQAAPVSVAYIEPSMSEDMIQFLIHIENVGDGRIVKEEKIIKDDASGGCPANVGMTDVDEVGIKVQVSALGLAECKNNNRIKLIDDKGIALCYIKKGTGTYSYTTEMEITLDYGYSSSITKSIEIINPFYIGT